MTQDLRLAYPSSCPTVSRRIDRGDVERWVTLERVTGPTRDRAIELRMYTRVDDQVPKG